VDLLDEARGQVQLSKPNAKLRLLDIMSHKIVASSPEDTRIDALASTTSKSYRIEEVPRSQEQVGENELLVPVAHYQKEIYSTFGHPFYLKLKEGEHFESVKDKIQKHLEVPDKEFEKYRISVITMGRAKYLDELQQDTVRIRDFMITGTGGNSMKPYIGLEHVNKNSKRARYNYMEKAIKIYN
jgi:ubiquitin carboxyl-terminal hydrolase 7